MNSRNMARTDSAGASRAETRSDINDLLETAREHFRESDYKVAEPLLQQLLVSDGKNPEVFHMLATIYYDQGKFNKAIRTFRRALEIDPTFTDASVGLSIILNDIGRYEEGKKVFQEAQEALARKNATSDPYMLEKLATKHDELGELYFQYKRYDEAMEQYERALNLSSRKSELKIKIVECLLRKDDTAQAFKELKNLVTEAPAFAPARLKLGMMYFNAKRTTDAIEQWESILLRDPEHPIALKYLQMAANQTGSTLLA